MAARPDVRTLIGALVAATLLAGCASSAEPEPETETVGQSSTPTPTPEPTPEPTTFTTQNGTASFALPDGWTVDDASAILTNHQGAQQWGNVVTLVDADGVVRAHYADGHGGDVGAHGEAGVVHAEQLADGTTAAAWWRHDATHDTWLPSAAVVDDVADPQPIVRTSDEQRLLSFMVDLAGVAECAAPIDEAAVVACLEAPTVTETLGVLATLEQHDVRWDAMPDGVDPIADAPWIEHLTADGVLAFSYPSSWSLVTHELPQGSLDGSFVTLVTPDGYQTLDIRTSRTSEAWLCDPDRPDPSAPRIQVLSGEPVDPFANASIDPGGSIEAVTFDFGDGTTGVALLHAEDAANGCFDPSLLAGSGSVSVSTPWGTDVEGSIYDLYPGGVGFVGSYEHDVLLDVLRSVAVRF